MAALPPFGTLDQLEAWLGIEIDADSPDQARAEALIASASTRVRTLTGSAWVDAAGALVWTGTDDTKLQLVGEALTEVTIAAAARAYENDAAGTVSETLGSYTYRITDDAAEGLYLTEEEQRSARDAVAQYRSRSRPGLWSLATTRGPIETTGVYVDVVGSDKPIPADTPL